MIELYRELCNYWKEYIFSKTPKFKNTTESFKEDEKIKQINVYLNSIFFYDDIEQDVPIWLEKEMESFFKQLEATL